jgi:threonine/homoserine/homoserine lactone efflux protein
MRYFTLHILALGAIFMVQAVIIFCLIGYFSGNIGSYLQERPKTAKYLDWLTAGVFVSLGIRLALAER